MLRLVTAALLGLLAASCVGVSKPRTPYYPVREGEPLAARVDGEPIPLRFVEQDLRLREDRTRGLVGLPESRKEHWRRQTPRLLAQRWVDLYLVEREAERRGFRVTDQEVAGEMDRRATALQDPDRVREMQRRYGVTVDDLRVRVRQKLLLRKFSASLRQDLEQRVSDADLRQYYRANLGLFRHPEQVYVRLVAVKDRERARRLARRAAAGEDFEQLARRFSEHFTRD